MVTSSTDWEDAMAAGKSKDASTIRIPKPLTDVQWRTLRAFHDREEHTRLMADPEALARRQALERRMIAFFEEHGVPVPRSQLIVTQRPRARQPKGRKAGARAR
jgi:hypothetical protein